MQTQLGQMNPTPDVSFLASPPTDNSFSHDIYINDDYPKVTLKAWYVSLLFNFF